MSALYTLIGIVICGGLIAVAAWWPERPLPSARVFIPMPNTPLTRQPLTADDLPWWGRQQPVKVISITLAVAMYISLLGLIYAFLGWGYVPYLGFYPVHYVFTAGGEAWSITGGWLPKVFAGAMALLVLISLQPFLSWIPSHKHTSDSKELYESFLKINVGVGMMTAAFACSTLAFFLVSLLHQAYGMVF